MIRHMLLTMALASLISPSCGSTGLEHSRENSGGTDPHAICFVVASAQDHRPLPHTDVLIVEKNSKDMRALGTTDELGSLCVSKNQLENGIVILFDHDAHFTGAMIVKPQLFRLDHRYIELAVFVIP